MADSNTFQSGQARVFIQKDGVAPSSPYLYYGCLALDGPSQDLGTPDPVYCPSSSQRNRWDTVDNIPKAPALGTSDFTQHMDKFLKDVWWELKKKGCTFNMQVVISSCARPDDFSKWDSKILFKGVRLTNLALPALNVITPDDNVAVDITGSLSFQEMKPLTGIAFGETAGSVVVAEALDGLFSDAISCGDCGSISDGCQKVYWLCTSNTGSPGLSAQIVYSLDGGNTWTALDINTLGGLSANRIAVVSGRLVVVSQVYGGHVHELLTDVDAGTMAWLGVKTGYVTGKSPRAIYSKSTTETFIAAQGGYIYTTTDPTVSVSVSSDGSVSTQDLNDIHGYGRTVVAVGGSNAVLKSDNAGDSWSLVVGPAVGVNLTAVWCMTQTTWFIGTGNGKLYYTVNAGTTWVQVALQAGITVVNDIKFVDDTVGFMAVEIAGAGRIYRTTDSGNSWQYQAPAITGLPTALRYNAVAPCDQNTITVGGIKTVGGDGIIAVGS